jgi:hypothetical protein
MPHVTSQLGCYGRAEVWSNNGNNNKFHSPSTAPVLASVGVAVFWSPTVPGRHGVLLSLSESGWGPPTSASIKSTMPCWASILVLVSLLGNKILNRDVKDSISFRGHVLECRVVVIALSVARG